jgi:excisionase family DNA binding protein
MDVRKEQLLTAKECAERLNISRASLSRLVAKGAIGYYRVGFKLMFSEAQISVFLESVESNQAQHHSPNLNSMGAADGQV